MEDRARCASGKEHPKGLSACSRKSLVRFHRPTSTTHLAIRPFLRHTSRGIVFSLLSIALLVISAQGASARPHAAHANTRIAIQKAPTPSAPDAPRPPTAPDLGSETQQNPPVEANPSTGGDGSASINLDLSGLTGDSGTSPDGKNTKPGQSVVIILLLSVIAIAPALLMMLTGFTRIVIVLSLVRNALGLQSIPPNQVVIGLAMFLAFFVMSPTLTAMNDTALQPLLKGDISQSVAYDRAVKPLQKFMLKQTRKEDLALFIKYDKGPRPKTAKDVKITQLIPAFVLSELKTAFIIGFVIFIPFLVIDLVVSSSLMSMGMFMLPPVLVSLPFKMLLFVMVDGWALITRALIASFH